jgi:Fe2+ transport system protein FeoA
MKFNLNNSGPRSTFASLADLSQGQTAEVTALQLPHNTSDHLMWLGFVPGAKVTVGQCGPGGDPRVYTVSGSSFALRRETAQHILIVSSIGVQA